jgi:hypothetical protein
VVASDVEPLLDELYGVEPKEFISTRDRIARELRAQGRRDDAAKIAARRRPTAAADSINRLAREYGDDLRDFVALGTRLRDAQVASVRDAAARDDVRALQRDRRALADHLAAKAPAHRDEVERALDAALVDDDVAATMLAGHLERVPAPASGFDALGSAMGDLPTPSLDRSGAKTHPNRPNKDEERVARAIEEEDAAKAEMSDATREVRRLRDELRSAERRAQEASRRAERATAKRRTLER